MMKERSFEEAERHAAEVNKKIHAGVMERFGIESKDFEDGSVVLSFSANDADFTTDANYYQDIKSDGSPPYTIAEALNILFEERFGISQDDKNPVAYFTAEIVRNALDYAGSCRGAVRKEGNRFMVTIDDDGPGIEDPEGAAFEHTHHGFDIVQEGVDVFTVETTGMRFKKTKDGVLRKVGQSDKKNGTRITFTCSVNKPNTEV